MMHSGKLLSLSGLFVLSGCLAEPVSAPSHAKLMAPADINLAWSIAYNETDDGVGSLVLLDFLVYHEETGDPMDNIEVEILSSWGGAYLIPKTAVKIVPPPEELDPSDCDQDGDGNIDEDAPDACSWYWDSSADQYFELATEFADAYHPNYLLAGTDEHGILRVWVYIDSMPVDSADEENGYYTFDEINVWASIGHESTEVSIGTDNE